MTIKEVLRRKGSKAITVFEDQAVQEAVQIMVENYIGAVIVVNRHHLMVGIFTERDILRRIAGKGECDKIAEIKVGNVMTSDVIVGHPDADTECVFKTMTEKRIRHIPVMDESKLLGIISIGDIVKTGLDDSKFEADCLRQYITGTR